MVKTASAFEGYFKNPKATEETFHFDEHGQKWLLTGDIGYINDDDNLFLIDRLKELLKYKGHQVQSGTPKVLKIEGTQSFAHKNDCENSRTKNAISLAP